MLKRIKSIGIVCLVMAALVTFTSCSKEKTIVGNWRIKTAKLIELTISDTTDVSMDRGEVWSFKKDGNCTLTIQGGKFEGTYSVRNNKLTVDVKYDSIQLYGDLDIVTGNINLWSFTGTLKMRELVTQETDNFKLEYYCEKI